MTRPKRAIKRGTPKAVAGIAAAAVMTLIGGGLVMSPLAQATPFDKDAITPSPEPTATATSTATATPTEIPSAEPTDDLFATPPSLRRESAPGAYYFFFNPHPEQEDRVVVERRVGGEGNEWEEAPRIISHFDTAEPGAKVQYRVIFDGKAYYTDEVTTYTMDNTPSPTPSGTPTPTPSGTPTPTPSGTPTTTPTGTPTTTPSGTPTTTPSRTPTTASPPTPAASASSTPEEEKNGLANTGV